MTTDEWAEKIAPLSDKEREEWIGPSPGGAAGDLGVTRQRIHQLLCEGKLDGIEIADHRDRGVAVFVTTASIRRYQESDRKRGPKPKGDKS